MSEFVSAAVTWLSQNPHWAGLAVFVINISESLVVIGLFVPGTIVMFGIGALVALGAMGLWETLGWAVAGAIVGDGISFLIGRHYRERMRSMWPFNRHPEWLGRAEEFFTRHGGKSVVFGRFAGPVRPIIPAVAGMMGMPAWKFYWVNFLSAITWAPAYIFPGVVLGTSLSLASKVGTRLVFLLGLALVLAWLIWVGVRRLYLFFQPRAQRIGLRLLVWGNAHPLFKDITAGLLDPNHPEAKALLELGAALVTGAALFVMALAGEIGHPDPLSLDYQVFTLFQDLRTPWADHLMVVIAALSDAPVNLALLVALFAWLAARGQYLAAAHWLAAGCGAVLAGWGLNWLIPATPPRPELVTALAEFAFPAAPAVVITSLYGFLAVLLAREIPVQLGRLPYSLLGVWIGLISLSQVYLGRHWLSDLISGITLGLAWAGLLGIAYRRHAHRPIGAVALLLVPVAVLVLLGGWLVGMHHTRDLDRYALHYPQRDMADSVWREGGWSELPAYRRDGGGDRGAPLTIQYAGSLADLRRRLESRGWGDPIPLELGTAILWLAPNPELAELPLLPQAHDGRHEALVLVRELPSEMGQAGTRLVLRLYPADIRLSESGQPLWLGTLIQEHLRGSLGLVTLPRDTKDYAKLVDWMGSDLGDWETRSVRRSATQSPGWDGRLLLAREIPAGPMGASSP